MVAGRCKDGAGLRNTAGSCGNVFKVLGGLDNVLVQRRRPAPAESAALRTWTLHRCGAGRPGALLVGGESLGGMTLLFIE